MDKQVLAIRHKIKQGNQSITRNHPPASPMGFSGGISEGFSEGQMAHFNLTERDLEILVALASHHILSISHIMILVGFPNLDRAQSRCRQLYHKGLLERTQHFFGEHGRPQFVYYLSSKGLKYVRSYLMEKTPTRPCRVKSEIFLDHLLLINSFWIYLKIACREGAIKLGSFIPEFDRSQGKRQKATRAVIEEPDTYKKHVLIPDAGFCLSGPLGKRLYFLEIDRATGKIQSKTYRSFHSQVQKYMWYQQTEGYARYNEMFDYQFPGFQVLYVTRSTKRIRSYQEALSQFDGLNRFVLFTIFEDLGPHTILEEIWYPSRREDLRIYSMLD